METKDIQLIMVPPKKITEGLETEQDRNDAIIGWANRFNEFMSDVSEDKKGILIVQHVNSDETG